MKRAFRVRCLGMVLLACVGLVVLSTERGGADPAPPASSGVELKIVKYAGLVEAVKAQRGKVVVVDVWADWCPNCKIAFPHLVELHRKHASEGLVCVSVTLDTPDKQNVALDFLQKKNATFPNYLLDEPQGVWQSRWDIVGPPLIFVFDRQGRRAGKFNDDGNHPYTHEDIEKLVLQLLPIK